MKPLFSLLVLVSFLFTQKSFTSELTYTAGMTGITCAACKKSISQSIGRIKGVKTIRISEKGAGQHQLTITTDGSKEISKSDVTSALGKDSHYQITTWSGGS